MEDKIFFTLIELTCLCFLVSLCKLEGRSPTYDLELFPSRPRRRKSRQWWGKTHTRCPTRVVRFIYTNRVTERVVATKEMAESESGDGEESESAPIVVPEGNIEEG